MARTSKLANRQPGPDPRPRGRPETAMIFQFKAKRRTGELRQVLEFVAKSWRFAVALTIP